MFIQSRIVNSESHNI